jgi:NADH:ubiquinone oxidoreductase subunit E
MDEQVVQKVDAVMARHGTNEEALVEILRDLSKSSGHLSTALLESVAERLRLPPSKVLSVASFYSMIDVEPRGRHVIKLCEDAPCHVPGGREVWEALERELGIPFGETTPDGEWTLLPTSCIGLCAVGPVMVIDDDDVYGNLTPEVIPEILASYREAEGGGEV